MAHSIPDDVENKGDAWRLTTAAGAWIVQLVQDPRCEQFYPIWHQTRARLHALLARAPEALHAQIAAEQWAVEKKTLAEFLRNEVNLSAELAAWTAPALLRGWECRVTGKEFSIPVKFWSHIPKGRKPKDGGDDIKQNITWFYRATVQAPPDSISKLADEYATTAQRHTDARSVVQNGIRQARGLLEIISRHDGLKETGERRIEWADPDPRLK